MLIPSRSLSEPLSGSAQFLREIHRHLGPASSETLLAFQAVFDLPDSRTGLLSICSELCADIHARDKPVRSPEVQAWHEAIDQLRRDIRTITGITDEHDRSTATTLKLPLASLLLTFPAISLRPQQERSLRCLRADLCLWHLSTKQRLPKEVVTSFIRLLKNHPESENQAILAAIPGTSKELESLRSTFDPASKTYRLLSHVHLGLSKSIRLPPLAPTPSIQVFSKSPLESTSYADEPPESAAPKPARQKNTSQDLILANLSRISFACPKELSGVTGLPEVTHPAELVEAFSALTKELGSTQRSAALGAIMTALCNARPRQFCLIPLHQTQKHAIWLDLQHGHICWILEAVTSKKRYLAYQKLNQASESPRLY